MMSAADLPYLRWGVLRLLSDGGGGYWAADFTVSDQLNRMGLLATFDQVRGELGWLAGLGLVKSESLPVGGGVRAMLTRRGLDVVEGRSRVDGVRRPLHLDLGD